MSENTNIVVPEECVEISYSDAEEMDGAGHARLTTNDTLAIGGTLLGLGLTITGLIKYGPQVYNSIVGGCGGNAGGNVNVNGVGRIFAPKQQRHFDSNGQIDNEGRASMNASIDRLENEIRNDSFQRAGIDMNNRNNSF